MILLSKKLFIEKSWCKGCGICIEFCPTGALGMDGEKVCMKEESKCVLCGLCELRCPDYAIYIQKDN